MSNGKKVLAAMSGGVDSSVAAALLHQQGYEVVGVFMCLGQPDGKKAGHTGCCRPEDADDARKVADRMGFKFQVLNFQRELEEIIRYFIDEYRRGRTPNPCILCNKRLKFGKLIDYARLIGADYVATGHYARLESINGRLFLSRAVDLQKDQSYALFAIGRENLGKVLLPVGQYTKTQVRQLARQMNLDIKDKAESQEICFVSDDDYVRFLLDRMPELAQPGKVVDTAGKVLGEHNGIFRYTIGQRRGLGIALGEPAYVVRLDAEKNEVVLGYRGDLLHKRLYAGGVQWLIDPAPAESFPATIQIRYNHRGQTGRVTPLPDRQGKLTLAKVDFDEPISAITPGQAAVFYDAALVLGGGWIDKAED